MSENRIPLQLTLALVLSVAGCTVTATSSGTPTDSASGGGDALLGDGESTANASAVSACKDACAAIGAGNADCKDYSTGHCLEACDALKSSLPSGCEPAAIARWNCLAKAKFTCVFTVGSSTDCGAELATLNACVAGGGATCKGGVSYCAGNVASVCSSDGMSSTVVQDCAQTGLTCSDGKCVAAPCPPGQKICDNNKAVVCSADGTAGASTDCGLTGLVCVKGTCQKNASTCPTVGEHQCDANGNSQFCGSDKLWTLAETCTDKAPCYKGKCAELCKPGSVRCVSGSDTGSGGKLETCNSDGHGYGKQVPCEGPTGSAPGCVASTGCNLAGDACNVKFNPSGTSCSTFTVCATAKCDGKGMCVDDKTDCNDGIACTVDYCGSILYGCIHLASGATCSDGNPCTTDWCEKGCNHAKAKIADCEGTIWGGHCYTIVDSEAFFDEYESKCLGAGEEPVLIESEAENTFVAGLFASSAGIWIGAVRHPDGKVYSYAGQELTFSKLPSPLPAWTDSGPVYVSMPYKKSGKWSLDHNGQGNMKGWICERPIDALPCNDDNVCTQGEVCGLNGKCVPGAATTCDDNDPCTADSCDTQQGCIFAPLAGCGTPTTVWEQGFDCNGLPDAWTTTDEAGGVSWSADVTPVILPDSSTACTVWLAGPNGTDCTGYASAATLKSEAIDMPAPATGESASLVIATRGTSDASASVTVQSLDPSGGVTVLGSWQVTEDAWQTLKFSLDPVKGKLGQRLEFVYQGQACINTLSQGPRLASVKILVGK